MLHLNRLMYRKRLMQRRPMHRGAAAVEFAVIAPVFVAILLGTIEACSMVFLRQSVEMAAYEAARVSVVNQTTSGQVETAAKTILDSRKIKDYSIKISPVDFQKAAYGTFITIEVRAPCSKNGLIPSMFYGSRDVVGIVEMMKEY
jgi:Flp pilus assembly protein TadG